jgi:exosortase/archaeosortase family protein
MKTKKNYRDAIYFLIKFFIIFFVLQTIIISLDLSFINYFITFISASYLNLPFLNNIIFVNGVMFKVTNSCTGLISSALLAAIIFSQKKSLEFRKIKYFVFGVLFLLIINVPRIMLVLLFAIIGQDANFVHALTWFFMSFIALFVWYLSEK